MKKNEEERRRKKKKEEMKWRCVICGVGVDGVRVWLGVRCGVVG